jgi:hypothetical protein
MGAGEFKLVMDSGMGPHGTVVRRNPHQGTAKGKNRTTEQHQFVHRNGLGKRHEAGQRKEEGQDGEVIAHKGNITQLALCAAAVRELL